MSDRSKKVPKKTRGGTPGRENTGWFKKGESGNPKGRPRGSKASAAPNSPLGFLLDNRVTITKDGQARKISLEDALEQKIFMLAMSGQRKAIRDVIKMIEKWSAWIAKRETKNDYTEIKMLSEALDPENIDEALMLLNIVTINPNRDPKDYPRPQLLVQPWAAQFALRRDRSLRDGDLRQAKFCTYDSASVIWT